MNDELKQEFTRRITKANKSDMIVILCDMFDIYVSDAKEVLDNFMGNDIRRNISREEKTTYKNAIKYARNVLLELINSLNREYEIANNIYALYRYVERRLIEADIKYDKAALVHAANIMKKLNTAYEKVAEVDISPAIMQNTEEVYAGMTYGRSNINASYMTDSNRGFFA